MALPPDQGNGAKVFSRLTAARLPEHVGKPAFQATECIRFLETYRDRPFLLMVNFLEPHNPFFSPFDSVYDAEEMVLPESWYREMEDAVPAHYRERRRGLMARLPDAATNDERGWKEVRARYWGQCTLIDKHAGRIVDQLETLGLADNTIVVYSTDHGDMMGEHRLIHKVTQYEGAVHVPLIVRAPGVAPQRIRTPISQVHLLPTLLELLRQQVPHVQGTSLVPLMADGDTAPDDAEVVIEWNGRRRTGADAGLRHGAGGAALALQAVDARTIRRGRWKLNVHGTGEAELYDLENDPGEMHNAIGDAQARSAARVLFERLREWQRQTGDPTAMPDIMGGKAMLRK